MGYIYNNRSIIAISNWEFAKSITKTRLSAPGLVMHNLQIKRIMPIMYFMHKMKNTYWSKIDSYIWSPRRS